MQKKIFSKVIFIFYEKKNGFSSNISTFYGQRLVPASWATRSPSTLEYCLFVLWSGICLAFSLDFVTVKEDAFYYD